MTSPSLPPLPRSWSELTWQQLCQCWSMKIRYGGNADVARVMAMLTLLGCSPVCCCATATNTTGGATNTTGGATLRTATGETLYRLRDKDDCLWTVTAREAAYLAKKTMPWLDYPYGDPGEKPEKDEKGKVIKEGREAVAGYVSAMRDAMILPIEELKISGSAGGIFVAAASKTFALPRVACNNLSWQQYRTLQSLAPLLFQEQASEEQARHLQAQFMAHILVPRSLALFDTTGGSIRFRPHYEYNYDESTAEGMVSWFEKGLKRDKDANSQFTTLFHISFQTYQTALTYYAKVYPLLFEGSTKNDPLRDALTGEVGTINSIMKYAGYSDQQEVYNSSLPFIFDILNTMTKEAKEIEKMNNRIKKR